MLDADVDEQTVMTAEVDSEVDSNYKVVEQTRYCVVPLWGHARGRRPRGGGAGAGLRQLRAAHARASVLRAIAMHLLDS